MSQVCKIARKLEEKVDSTALADFRRLVEPAVVHVIREGCRECTRTLAALAEPRRDLLAEARWIDQWPAETQADEAARALAARLVPMPDSRRRMYVLSSERICGRSLVEALIGESRALLSTNSDQAVELAEFALFCADSIAPDRYSDPLVFDLQAKALAHLANAQRRAGDFRVAAGAIEEAEAALTLGSESPEIVGFVWVRKGRLLADQGDLDAALGEMSDAVALPVAAASELGKALYQRSAVLAALDRNDEAISDLHAALVFLDFETEPRLRFVVAFGLAVRYEQAGQLDNALRYLDRATRSWSHAMNPGDHVRVAWARGRIHAAQGDLEAARIDFAAARDGFLALDYPLDAAIVTLELAVILAEEGRFRDVASLASEMLATFRAAGVSREATAALYLLEKARTVAAVRQVAATLTRLKASGPASDPER